MNQTLIINKKEAEALLTFEDAIKAMREVFAAISQGDAIMLQREMIKHENGNALAVMPASMKDKGITGSKIIIFPGKQTRKAGTNQGVFPLFSIDTGALLAITDAEAMTVIRTAAASALATDILALKEASSLCILGTGKQGLAHAEAICLVRNIKNIYLWNKNRDTGRAAVKRFQEKLGISVAYFENSGDAVKNADIICTTSKAHEPILFGKDIKEGAHINAVGACSSKIREIDTEVLKRAKVFCDKKEACFKDAGDLLIPLEKGEIHKDIVIGEIGQIILGESQGRTSNVEITLFESVGLSVQDLASAWLIYEKALKSGHGIKVEL